MSKLKRVGGGSLILAILAVGPGFFQAWADEPTIGQDDIVTVHVKQAGGSVAVGGTVIAHKSVTLAAQTPGRVEYIGGKEGDRFRANAHLITLDDDALRAKLRAAYAQRESATAALRNAGVQLDRELQSKGKSASQGGMGMPMMDQMMNPMQGFMGGQRQSKIDRRVDIVARQTTVEQARTSLMQADSQIQEMQARLRDTKSVAPFNGVIVKKFVEVGDTVQPGQPLLEFSDTTALQIQVDVAARLSAGLRQGMQLAARLDVSDRPISVQVARIFPVADVERHTVRVRLDMPRGTRAAAGMYAEVQIPDLRVRAAPMMAIPNSAIRWKGGLPLVFVVNEQNRTQLRMVRLGDSINEQEVAVLAGLREGERLVARPRPGMRAGDLVTP